MWLKEVNVDKINGVVNFTSAMAVAPRYGLNSYPQDTFVKTTDVNSSCVTNPFHIIKDDFLAYLMPQELIKKYSNQAVLEKTSALNSNIRANLAQSLVRTKANAANVSSVIDSHLLPTAQVASSIMKSSKLPFSKRDYTTMQKAALLHDIGKAFIPPEILNKPGKLNDYERQVVDKHAQIGYEVLKTSGVDTPVLELVKNHHNYSKNNPALVQILQISDIFSALKEHRSYKEPFSDKQALDILYSRAQNGDFDKKYVDALSAALVS